jgi:predicted amidohydrolase YtcJ
MSFRNAVGRRALALAVVTGTAGEASPLFAASTIYANGDILTMKGVTPEYGEALVENDGKIAFVGRLPEAQKIAGKSARTIDLKGRTLLPGFIDTHGHMVYFGKNLIDADLVGVTDIPELIARMRRQAAMTPKGAWIVGFGYRARNLEEGRTPTVEELDQVAADRPVMIVDSSGHLGAGNSALFKLTGIGAATPDPEGGVFARKADGKALAGPMEETALNAVRSQRPPFTGALADKVITGGAALWARHGQTTAQDCGVGLGNDDIEIVRNAIDRKLLNIDLYICAKDSALDAALSTAKNVTRDYGLQDVEGGDVASRQEAIVDQARTPNGQGVTKLLDARPDLDRRYVNRVRLGGVKFWLDGSLDTAWFTKPYTVNPPGKTGAFSGYQQIPNDVLDAAFDKYWTSNLQINMHMNGDAAADQALAAIRKAVDKYGMRDHRPVFIHASYLRPDQIEQMKRYGAVPSFLSVGVTSGGDAVMKLWGPERASHAMAAGTFVKAGLPFAFSHDAPVTPSPSVIALVDAGVNRRTASGLVVGPDERVSPYDALRAVTVNAAFQIKEEAAKGTLEPGKLADLVILEKNPLKVDPTTIKDIRVIETIKEGKTVYRDVDAK